MIYKIARWLFGVCCMIGFVAPACAGDNCMLTAPPHTAAVNADHGAFYFFYPRDIAPKYSGCQTMWNEHGDIVFVLKFDHGALKSYREFDMPKRKAILSCIYNAKVLKTDSSDCPPYEDIETGFMILPEADELRVPVERDPRR